MLPGLTAHHRGRRRPDDHEYRRGRVVHPPAAGPATGTATFAAARELGETFGVALLLGLVTRQDALHGAQRGWVLVVVVSVIAAVTARLVGRAQHPDQAGAAN